MSVMSRAPAQGQFAIILTHNRPELLAACVASVHDQVDMVMIIDNASDPPATVTGDYDNVVVVHDPTQPPNLARLWNRGFHAVAMHRPPHVHRWDLAVLCDDVEVPPGWVHQVATTMRTHGAIAGATHGHTPVTTPILKQAPDTDIHNRMPGQAFILAGEAGLRADETMHWWWCDTDLDQQARLAGGMVISPGPVVHNIRPNDFTYAVPGLAERAAQDRVAFADKWGTVPW